MEPVPEVQAPAAETNRPIAPLWHALPSLGFIVLVSGIRCESPNMRSDNLTANCSIS